MKTLDTPTTFWRQAQALQRNLPPLPGSRVDEDLERLERAHATSLKNVLRVVGDSHEEPQTRAAACWLLGRLGKRGAVPSLLSVMTDPHPEVRRAAIEALGVIGHTWAMVPITVALRTDPDRGVRETAAYALGHIGTKRAAEPLLETASRPTEDVRVRSMALEQLGNLGERRVIPYLVASLRDSSPEIRFWSVFALSELGDPTVIPELERVASSDDTLISSFGTIAEEAQDAIQRLQRTT